MCEVHKLYYVNWEVMCIDLRYTYRIMYFHASASNMYINAKLYENILKNLCTDFWFCLNFYNIPISVDDSSHTSNKIT
jgi:hypothetical protein